MYEYVLENKGLSIERLHLLCEVARAGGIKAAVGEDGAASDADLKAGCTITISSIAQTVANAATV